MLLVQRQTTPILGRIFGYTWSSHTIILKVRKAMKILWKRKRLRSEIYSGWKESDRVLSVPARTGLDGRNFWNKVCQLLKQSLATQMCWNWCSLATATSRHKLQPAVWISRAVLCCLFFYLQPLPISTYFHRLRLLSEKFAYRCSKLSIFPLHSKHLISKGRPWGEWSIQGCASQSWILRQGRCKTSAGRRPPAGNSSHHSAFE